MRNLQNLVLTDDHERMETNVKNVFVIEISLNPGSMLVVTVAKRVISNDQRKTIKK